MDISQTVLNNFLVIRPSGRLDTKTSPDLELFFNEYLDVGQSGSILDMTDLDYISSAGLRVILNFSKLLKKRNLKFTICKMQDHIREIFEISGFDLFVDICTSLEKATEQK